MCFRALIILASLLLGLSGPAAAADEGSLKVTQPWARASLGQVKVGAAYLTIENHGQHADRLVGLASPVANHVELHNTIMDEGVMKMRPMEVLELAPGETAALEPGGMHVMLMGLKQPLKEGETFPMTLSFAEAGEVTIQVQVDKATASGPSGGHGGMDHATMDHGSMDHGSMDHAAHHEAHHGKAIEMDGESGPSLRLQVVGDPEEGWLIMLDTDNFAFSEAHADQPHQEGEGHAHLYVDGEKITRVYEDNYRVESLPEGSHEIRVSLHTNDHRHYQVDGHQVAADVTIEAGANEKPEAAIHVVDLQIRGRKVLGPDTVRVTEGEQVRLEWSSDEATELHLHGYDILTGIEQGDPTITSFEAHSAGRFPITSHGFGAHDHSHTTLLYLEVLPD